MKPPNALFPSPVDRRLPTFLRPLSQKLAFAFVLSTGSACAVCGAEAVAWAQSDPSAADVESARAAFLQGLDLRDRAHDNGAAITKFKAAFALVQTPKIGFELGKTYRMQGDLVSAREAFLAVDRIPVRKNESPDAKKARDDSAAQAAELEAKVPSLTITIVGAGQVSIDGQAVRKDTLSAPRRMNPGPHVVQFLVDGEAKDQKVVELHEGDQKSIQFNGPAGGTTKPPPVGNGNGDGTEWKPNGNGDSSWKPPGYNTRPNPARPIVFTVAGISAGAGVVFGILAISAVGSAKSACTDGKCNADFPSLKSKAMTMSVIADVCFGVAIVTGIVGLVLPRTIVESGAEVGFSPIPGGGFLTAGGRF